MNQSTSNFNCEKCNDLGFIFIVENGYDKAIECSCHIEKRIKASLMTSGISFEEYELKSLDTFKADNEMATLMKDAAIKFLDSDAKGIGYFGRSGIGKTHICIAICQELTKRKHLAHKYFAYKSEMQKLKANYFDAEGYERLISRWVNCDVLYIDDLFKFSTDKNGKTRSQDLEIMFDIINTRYLNKSITIFSSEHTVKDIYNIDEALGSRIFAMVNPYGVKCEGDNRRLKEVKNETD